MKNCLEKKVSRIINKWAKKEGLPNISNYKENIVDKYNLDSLNCLSLTMDLEEGLEIEISDKDIDEMFKTPLSKSYIGNKPAYASVKTISEYLRSHELISD